MENRVLSRVKVTEIKNYELYEFICSFKQLLKKYANKLQYTDAYYDLAESLIEIISKLDTIKDTSAGAVVKYINKSIYHKYISLSKLNQRYSDTHFLFGEAEDVRTSSYCYDRYDFINIDFLKSCLTDKEYEIIILHFYYDYSIAEIADAKHVSRQSINQTKLIALKKLRNGYINMEKI